MFWSAYSHGDGRSDDDELQRNHHNAVPAVLANNCRSYPQPCLSLRAAHPSPIESTETIPPSPDPLGPPPPLRPPGPDDPTNYPTCVLGSAPLPNAPGGTQTDGPFLRVLVLLPPRALHKNHRAATTYTTVTCTSSSFASSRNQFEPVSRSSKTNNLYRLPTSSNLKPANRRKEFITT